MAGSCKLLVVDDQLEICELIEACLGEQGFAVDRATDVVTARGKLEAQAYDLAVLDIMMPGESGLELASLADRRGVSVLLMSGHPEWITDVARWSSYRLLAKPFRLEELTAAVLALLALRSPIPPQPRRKRQLA